MAGPRQAFIEIPLTVFSDKSWGAGACVTAHTVNTLSSIPTAGFPGAFFGGTVILVHFTLDPMRSKRADTFEAVDEVDAGSSMETGLRVAFINIILTVHPLVAWFTYALVCALIVLACSSIATGV